MQTPHGPITVMYDEENLVVTLKFDSPDEWSQFIWGQFNKNNSSEYNIGTTEFTNTLETTKLEGTKIWSIGRETTISGNPILTLTRTVTTTEGEGEAQTTITSPPETVTVTVKEGEGDAVTEKTVNLQPTWSGTGMTRTFKYSGLPKYDKNGKEYTYSVSEYKFTIDGVTYTLTRNEDGSYSASPDEEHPNAAKIRVTQTGNNITNTEIKDFEFNKEWLAPGGDQVNEWKDTITVQVVRQIGDTIDTGFVLQYTITPLNYNSSNGIAPDEGSSGTQVLKPQPQSGSDFTFKVEDLEKFGTIGETAAGEFTYYVKETVPPTTGYMPPAYKDAEGTPIQTGAANGDQAPHQGTIVNQENAGVELPQTGGIGTTLFTALGGLLTVTAGAILTMRRRKRAQTSSL